MIDAIISSMRIKVTLLVVSIYCAIVCILPNAHAEEELTLEVLWADESYRGDYEPMEFFASDPPEKYYMSKTSEFNIDDVEDIRLYYGRRQGFAGLIIIFSEESVDGIKSIYQKSPDEIMGLVVNKRLVRVDNVSDFFQNKRVKADAIFETLEANLIIKAFLDKKKKLEKIRVLIVSIISSVSFMICVSVSLFGVFFVRGKVVSRRKKIMFEENEASEKRKRDAPWQMPF